MSDTTEASDTPGAAPDERPLLEVFADIAALIPRGTVEPNSQRWKGMDGITAWQLIERHADNWPDIGLMMDEWLTANLPQPGLPTLTDEQIIRLRQGSRCTDPRKPWGDTLAFARTLLAVADQSRQIADLHREIRRLQRFEKEVERVCAYWLTDAIAGSDLSPTENVVLALYAMRAAAQGEVQAVQAVQAASEAPAAVAAGQDEVLTTKPDVADIIAGALPTSRGHAYQLMREALLEARGGVDPLDLAPDGLFGSLEGNEGYRGPLRTRANDFRWLPRSTPPALGLRVRVLMDAGHVGNPHHPGYPHGKWEEESEVCGIDGLGRAIFTCELVQTGVVTHWQLIVPGEVLTPISVLPLTEQERGQRLQGIDHLNEIFQEIAQDQAAARTPTADLPPGAVPVTLADLEDLGVNLSALGDHCPQGAEYAAAQAPDGYVVWHEDPGTWHGLTDRAMAEAYAHWHHSEARGFRLLPKQPPLPNNPYLTPQEHKDQQR